MDFTPINWSEVSRHTKRKKKKRKKTSTRKEEGRLEKRSEGRKGSGPLWGCSNVDLVEPSLLEPPTVSPLSLKKISSHRCWSRCSRGRWQGFGLCFPKQRSWKWSCRRRPLIADRCSSVSSAPTAAARSQDEQSFPFSSSLPIFSLFFSSFSSARSLLFFWLVFRNGWNVLFDRLEPLLDKDHWSWGSHYGAHCNDDGWDGDGDEVELVGMGMGMGLEWGG